MPALVVVGHDARTDGIFSLNDLSGSTGRLDVLLRCVNSAFMLSNNIRRDVDLYLVLLGAPQPPKTIRLVGSKLKFLNPDERSTGALVKNALSKNLGVEEIEATPGIFVCNMGLAGVLARLKSRRIVYVKESGITIDKFKLNSEDAFVLGGQKDLTPDEEAVVLANDNVTKISLGPKSLHSDHCITVILNALDRVV
jgi:tRNA (pseudouridine54-N1)-methyltransferase